MSASHDPNFDPERDLVLERVIDVPRERVWDAWTRPELLKRWFCPAPWQVVAAEIDLRPGGVFRTAMRGPDGEASEAAGCVLEVVEHAKLVWTDALAPGYRPAAEPFFTAEIRLAPEGDGTRYTAIARHGTPEARKQHEEMGFHEGWGLALDQLVALAKEPTPA
jgi:uncharacterized protein YndB with AHSA1/START domain